MTEERQEYGLDFDLGYNGRTEKVCIEVAKYSDNGRLFVGLITDDGEGCPESAADLTVNIPEFPMEPGEAAITNDMRRQVLKFIRDNCLAEDTGKTAFSGMGMYPVFRFDLDRLAQFAPEDVADFKKTWGIS